MAFSISAHGLFIHRCIFLKGTLERAWPISAELTQSNTHEYYISMGFGVRVDELNFIHTEKEARKWKKGLERRAFQEYLS